MCRVVHDGRPGDGRGGVHLSRDLSFGRCDGKEVEVEAEAEAEAVCCGDEDEDWSGLA